MVNQIEVIDDKIQVTKMVPVVESFTSEQLQDDILNYQNQIINLQLLITEKQNLLNQLGA